MLWRHTRDVSCEMLPKLLQYRIPLILGQEQALFKAENLYLSFRLDQPIPSVVVFDKQNRKQPNEDVCYVLELTQRKTPQLQ